MSMRAFVVNHRKQLLPAGGVLALLVVWLLLGTGTDDRSAGRGPAAGGSAAAGEGEDAGYTIADTSWAHLPPNGTPEPAPYLSPEEERMVKDLQQRLQNMDIAIEGK